MSTRLDSAWFGSSRTAEEEWTTSVSRVGARVRTRESDAEMASSNPTSGAVRIDVLVVDDQPSVATSTADILRSEGFHAETAQTVEDALQVIASSDVGTVIVDHQIADNGESLLTRGLDLPPVIVMSGMGRSELAKVQAAHGDRLFACLAKPVPPLDLIEVVRAAIANR